MVDFPMNILTRAAVLLLLSAASANAGTCERREPVVVDRTQAYAGSMPNGRCFVSIGPSYSPDLVYRSYTFFDDGLLMVFESYGDNENNSTQTAAREFYFFPRSAAPTLEISANRRSVTVRMADGGRAVFDPASGQIASLEHGDLSVSPRVDPGSHGGVEIYRYDGLLLDAGYRRGGSPAGRRDGISTFRGPHGQVCAVRNEDIFRYTRDGDHFFAFTDTELSSWLKTRCPALFSGF